MKRVLTFLAICSLCGSTTAAVASTTSNTFQAAGCHAKVSATLQIQKNGAWKNLKSVVGWKKVKGCPSTNPYQPYTKANVGYGVKTRWHIYAPGNWDFYSDPSVLTKPSVQTKDSVPTKPSVPTKSFAPATPCQILSQDGNLGLSQGFPKRQERLKSNGTINAIVIPVDFPDVIGTNPPETEYNKMLEGMNTFYKKMSGGKVDFKFTILPSYVRIPSKSDKYGLGKWSSGDVGSYIQDAIKAADPLVQFDKFDVFYFLSPRQIPWASIAYGPAILAPMPTADGNIQNITFSGADAYQDFPGADWKWISHETGHLFGLHDLYVNGGDPTYGAWDIMSLNWSTAAIELNAWNRYIQGWLSDSQINCLQLSKPETTEITLSPIEREDSLTKATVVKISDSKILVIESRRSEGLDVLSAEQSGTLVYTVDMKIGSIKGGWKTQRRLGSNNEDFIDSALKVGDKITAEGVTIEVLSQTDAGDRIKISY